jgi:hypothetical protein
LLNQANNIDSSNWIGQYFIPSLPNNAVYWRITRVRYAAQVHGSNGGIVRVQVRTAAGNGLPSSTVLDSVELLETNLPSNFGTIDSYFTGNARLDPSSGACVVFRWVKDADACDILTRTVSLALLGGAKVVSTSNAGSSWSGNSLSSMPLVVYGVSATQDADTYTYNLNSVRITLRSGADSAARVNGAAYLFSEPQVTGP